MMDLGDRPEEFGKSIFSDEYRDQAIAIPAYDEGHNRITCPRYPRHRKKLDRFTIEALIS